MRELGPWNKEQYEDFLPIARMQAARKDTGRQKLIAINGVIYDISPEAATAIVEEMARTDPMIKSEVESNPGLLPAQVRWRLRDKPKNPKRKNPKRKNPKRKNPKLTTSQRKERRKYVVYGGYGEPLGFLRYGGYTYHHGVYPGELAAELYRAKRGSKIRVVPEENVSDKVYQLAQEVERSGYYRR